MPSDDSIPSFLNLSAPKTRTRKSTKPSVPHASQSHRNEWVQSALDLTPPAPRTYQPIVLEPQPEPAPPLRPALYTVRQLINEIRQVVEGAYTATVNVEGEVSNCRPAASGHVYFTLKDGDAQLPVVMFRRQASLLGFKLKDGLAVEVRGRIVVYETRGQIQLIAETLRPRGTGALQLAFEQLRDKLRREGLFDRPKKSLPPFPHCIGIVTSPHGAAIRDIINVVRRRHARLNILIFPAPMQGPSCGPRVAAGIRYFNQIAAQKAQSDQLDQSVPHSSQSHRDEWVPPQIPCVDLILITRGGGSFEDLNGFNHELLARTIAASNLPVVSAIGHEIDHTIADYVADLRAPTPSAAAELITAAQHRIGERVLSLEKRVHRSGDLHLLRSRRRFERLSATQVLARLRDGVSLRQQKIDELRFRLTAAFRASEARRQRTRATRLNALEARLRRHDPAVRLALAHRRLAASQQRLTRLATDLTRRRQAPLAAARLRLEALSPLAVLNRGYAIVYLESGEKNQLLRDSAQAQPSQTIRARLAQGSVRATITETTNQ